MDRQTIAERLMRSAEVAREFAETLVTEALPAALVFRVRLNRSADQVVAQRPGELRFPEDSGLERDRDLRRCDVDQAIDELWRDGRVPEWVNVAVVGETGTSTVIELVCCGRFTADESRLYHVEEGRPPFHVLSPVIPPAHLGGRYSVHHRSECWDEADVDRLATVTDKVWSLTVCTDEFDGRALVALPELPRLEVFEHDVCALGADAMSVFSRFPRLRVVRLFLVGPSAFALGGAGCCPALTTVAINNLPSRPWGFAHLARQAPATTDVTLRCADTLWLDGAFPDGVRAVTLTAGRIAGTPQLPARLDRLAVGLRQGSDAEVLRLLAGVEELRSLTLRGTPVSDELARMLSLRFNLRHVDVDETAGPR